MVRTHDREEDEDAITEPLLASFPANMPSSRALRKMNFTIYS